MKNKLLLGALLAVGFMPFLSAMHMSALLIVNQDASPAIITVIYDNEIKRDVIVGGGTEAISSNATKSLVFSFGSTHWIIRDFPVLLNPSIMEIRSNGSYRILSSGKVIANSIAEPYYPEEV